jgi:glycosyltransferase involved in cell wall biosynthesis
MNAIAAKVWKSRLMAMVCLAFVAGTPIRIARKMRRLPPRIWHGPSPLHLTASMVQADRLAGFASRSVVLTLRHSSYELWKQSDFDRVVDSRSLPGDELHWHALADLLWYGDIWSAYFDSLFFPAVSRKANQVVFHLLALAGIKVVVAPHGGDIVHRRPFVDRYDVVERKQKDYPAWDLTEFASVARVRIDLFCRHASVVLGADNGMRRYLPRCDLLFKYFPVDCEALLPLPALPRGIVTIAHAPNHRLIKGTDHLVAAIEQLNRAGIACKLDLIEKTPHAQAIQRYQAAAVIADQFCDGAFGKLATEGLAMGKPVLTYLDQEHLGNPVYNLPIVNTNAENLSQVLAALIQVPVLAERLGKAGRQQVERFQSVAALAEVWARIYGNVWWGSPLIL